MTQPINLRQFRKKKAREDKAKQSETNRVQFGTPKAQRDLEKAREAKRKAAPPTVKSKNVERKRPRR